MCTHRIPQTWYKGDMECTVCYTTSRCITTAHHLPKRGPGWGPKGVQGGRGKGVPLPWVPQMGPLKVTRRRPVIRTKGRQRGIRVTGRKQVVSKGSRNPWNPGNPTPPDPGGLRTPSDPRTSGPPTHLDLTHHLGYPPHLDVLISIVLTEDNTP